MSEKFNLNNPENQDQKEKRDKKSLVKKLAAVGATALLGVGGYLALSSGEGNPEEEHGKEYHNLDSDYSFFGVIDTPGELEPPVGCSVIDKKRVKRGL